MKKKWMLWIALLSLALPLSQAWAFNAYINCATTPLAQTYSTSSPSLAMSHVGTPFQAGLSMINNTTGRICLNTVSTSTLAPTAGNGNEHCLPVNAVLVLDHINVPTRFTSIYVRGDLANCTSGTIDIDLW